MTVRRMQEELTQWGCWARGTERHPGLKRYESPTYTMLRQNVAQHATGQTITLDDDALLAIDNLVGLLNNSRPDLCTWIIDFYLSGHSVRTLEKLNKVSRIKIDQYLLAGETWLDCKLESLCERVNSGLIG